jgi:host factor-I protein
VGLFRHILMDRMLSSRSFNLIHDRSGYQATSRDWFQRYVDILSLQRERVMSAQSTEALQGMFLNHVRDNRVEVTIFLANGIRLQGQIRSFDNFTVQPVRGNGTQIVYKHAISAIHPTGLVQLIDPASLR